MKKQIQTAYIKGNPHGCIACWKCVEACSKQVLGKVSFLWHKHVIIRNADACIGCKKCIKICPQQVFSEIKRV